MRHNIEQKYSLLTYPHILFDSYIFNLKKTPNTPLLNADVYNSLIEREKK